MFKKEDLKFEMYVGLWILCWSFCVVELGWINFVFGFFIVLVGEVCWNFFNKFCLLFRGIVLFFESLGLCIVYFLILVGYLELLEIIGEKLVLGFLYFCFWEIFC